MSEHGERYLELLNEMEWHRANSELSRAAEIAFAERLDHLWRQLDESEREEIEGELVMLDATVGIEGSLGEDTPEGSNEPRQAAAA
jgi:hypothetical protein